jgi:hypothetical protein
MTCPQLCTLSFTIGIIKPQATQRMVKIDLISR